MAEVADEKPLHLMNSNLHGQIRLSFAGDSHTATSAFYFLDIAYGTEPESCVDDAKIMPPEPAKETTNSTYYSWHGLTSTRKISLDPLRTHWQKSYRHSVCFQLKHVTLLNSAVPPPIKSVMAFMEEATARG